MDLTLRLEDPVVRARQAINTPQAARIASRILDYNITQLLNLAPGGIVVTNAPYDGEPPPHLLVGYYYLTRVLNGYLFDRRTFTNISFDIWQAGFTRSWRMVWRILTDCVYTVNVGRYTELISGDVVLGDQLRQVQNALLLDRIVAPLRPREMRGIGLEEAIARQRDRLIMDVTSQYGTTSHHRVSCMPPFIPTTHRRARSSAAYFLDTFRATAIGRNEVDILIQQNKVKMALVYFLAACRDPHCKTELSLPCADDLWVQKFIDHFSSEETAARQHSVQDEGDDMLVDILTSLVAGKGEAKTNNLRGGAGGTTLRSGRRIGLPFNLRPRIRRGVVESGRRSAERFVDRLPATRRRRRPTPAPAAPPTPERPEEDPLEGPSGLQVPTVPSPEISEEEETRSLVESVAEDEEEEEPEEMRPEEFNEEIIRVLSGIIAELERRLASEDIPRGIYFNFPQRFNRLLLRALNRGLLNPHFARRWVTNFFLMEHLAATLFYIHTRFDANIVQQYLDIDFVQVILRARDDEGREVFSRVWLEQGRQATESLYRRLLDDFLVVTEHSDVAAFAAPEEREQLLMDMNFVDNSGDVEDVIAQITVNDEQVDAVELAFRIKFSGLVAFSRNPRVLDNYEGILQRWERQRRPGRAPQQ